MLVERKPRVFQDRDGALVVRNSADGKTIDNFDFTRSLNGNTISTLVVVTDGPTVNASAINADSTSIDLTVTGLGELTATVTDSAGGVVEQLFRYHEPPVRNSTERYGDDC